MEEYEEVLKRTFLEEAGQLLEEVEEALLDLEKDRNSKNILDRIFRLAHNLKGSANGIGLTSVGEFTHNLENVLTLVINGNCPIDDKMLDLLLRSIDRITFMIGVLNEDLEATFNNEVLLEEMTEYLGPSESSESAAKSSANDFVSFDDIADEDTGSKSEAKPNPKNKKTKKKKKPGNVRETSRKKSTTTMATDESPPSTRAENSSNLSKTKTMVSDQTLRVSHNRVNSVIDLAGQVVVMHRLLKQRSEKINDSELTQIVNDMTRFVTKLRDQSLGLRMLSVKTVFQKLQRVCSDTSRLVKKKIEVDLQGMDLEIDKDILDSIADPLVHLVRNACDHGIELPDVRTSNGKSAEGHLQVIARYDEKNLIFELIDDGGGIDPEKIFQIAIKRGVVPQDAALTDAEKIDLIFQPGFSSKEEVTSVSGRGVGMDVVRTNIDAMHGRIEVSSVVGKGTTFRVILPTTLALIDGVVVDCNSEKLLLPISNVAEVELYDPERVKLGHGSDQLLSFREEELPVYSLSQLMGWTVSDYGERKQISVIAKTPTGKCAIIVDDIVGRIQVVARELKDKHYKLTGVSAVTQLSSGNPMLILDVGELVRRTHEMNQVSDHPDHLAKTEGF